MTKCLAVGLGGLLVLAGCPPADSLPVPPLTYGVEAHWPDRHDYPGVGAGRILVTNSLEDSLSMFELAKLGASELPELARLPLGVIPVEIEGIHHAAVDPAGQLLYVGISNYAPGTGGGPHGSHGAGTVDGYALKVRMSDFRVVGSVRVDRNPGDIVLSPDGRLLFLSHFDLLRITEVVGAGGSTQDMDARVAIIDAASMTRKAMVTACAAPHGMVVSADSQRLYVSCYSDEVAVVDLLTDGFPVKRVKVLGGPGGPTDPRHQPYALTLAPNGEVWVSNYASGQLQVLNPTTLAFDPNRIIPLGGRPMFGSFSPDGQLLYIPRQGVDKVTVVDAASGAIVRDLSVPELLCRNLHQVLVAPNPELLLVVCEGQRRYPGALVVLHEATGAVVSATPVGLFPDDVEILQGAGP